ncbi:flavin reductase family protein [Aldersonia kunmingensis]|uniref:flavin reductase family protein n=1 Tax=Aldersonia kunmingensis TaxID=408066 RepID=UPI00082EF550|nr:flavin reductase family protein [Aldersonia kunmingensis]
MDEERAHAFEKMMDELDYPMFVVTTRAGDRLAGCLVGFATQTSIDPPRFLVGLSKLNHTFRIAVDAPGLVVHIVAREHRDLVELFGGTTGDEVDKFAQCEWSDGPMGIPVLHAAAGWFSGRTLASFDVGDHMAFQLEPGPGEVGSMVGELVTYQDVFGLKPGHEA